MLRKEILDTVKISVISLAVAFMTLVFSFWALNLSVPEVVTFNELLCYLIEIILLLISLVLASSLFAEEKKQDSFEYLFSLRLSRMEILWNKLLPRLAVLVVYLVIYWLFSAVLARYPLLLGARIFIPLLLAIFLFFASLSLLHRHHILNIVYNSFIFFFLLLVIISVSNILSTSFQSYSSLLDRVTVTEIALQIFLLLALVFFLGFVFTFKKIDLSNMTYRFLKKYIARIGLGVLGLFLVWIMINRFDSDRNPRAFTVKDLRPATFDADNGFYRLYSLLEPPQVDVESPQVILKYRRLHDPGYDNDKYIKEYKKLSFEPFLGTGKGSPWLSFPHSVNLWNDYVLKNRNVINSSEKKFEVLLRRYQRLVDSPVFEDFSRISYRSPIPNLLAWLRIARIHIGLHMLTALEGEWRRGVAGILNHVNFCKRTLRGSRILITNLIGKSVACLSLQALVSLMSHPDCPPEVFRQVAEGLPDITYEEFGSRNCFIGEYILWEKFFRDDCLKQYKRLGDRLLIRFFLQKNRSQRLVFDFMSTIIDYEARPPYQFDFSRIRQLEKEVEGLMEGWWWWVQNPVGKILLNTQHSPNFINITMKSYYTKALYDMARIIAEFRLNHTPGRPVQETLNGLETYRTLMDPGSGKSYVYSREKGLLYSLGTDLDDDGGKGEPITSTDTDFVLPLSLSADQ